MNGWADVWNVMKCVWIGEWMSEIDVWFSTCMAIAWTKKKDHPKIEWVN